MTLGVLSPPVPHARPLAAPEPHTGVKRAGVFPQPKSQTEVWGPVTQELTVRPPRHPGHVSPSSRGPVRDVVPLDLGPVLVCLLTLAAQGGELARPEAPGRVPARYPGCIWLRRVLCPLLDTCAPWERYTNEDWVKSTTFPPAASLSVQVCTPAAREPDALTVRCIPSGLKGPLPGLRGDTRVRPGPTAGSSSNPRVQGQFTNHHLCSFPVSKSMILTKCTEACSHCHA